MKGISLSSPRDKLVKLPVKDSGKSVQSGTKGIRFGIELKIKTLANRTIDMLKLFPGFCDWWFTMDEGQRSFIFEDLHVTMLKEFVNLTGMVEQKAEQLRSCIVKYFDNVPGFTQWKTVVAGADLRGRVNYQLKDHLWDEMRKAYM